MDLKKIVERLSKKGTKNTMFNILIILLIGLFIVIISDLFKSTSAKTSIKQKDKYE